jgi:hypothetical protein
METIQEILAEWDKDSRVELSSLDIYSANLPYLHSKYLNIYSEAREYKRKINKKYNSYRHELIEYFRCNRNSKEDLDRLGRKACQTVVPHDAIQRFLMADTEFANISEKMEEVDDKIEMLKSILDKILKTSFDIKNAIGFLNFKNGVV